jgi:hypothetical protein
MQVYRAELRVYIHDRQVIQHTFVTAVADAKAAWAIAKAAAGTNSAKRIIARNDYYEALATAALNRQNALNALKKPVPPVVTPATNTAVTTTTLIPHSGL